MEVEENYNMELLIILIKINLLIILIIELIMISIIKLLTIIKIIIHMLCHQIVVKIY